MHRTMLIGKKQRLVNLGKVPWRLPCCQSQFWRSMMGAVLLLQHQGGARLLQIDNICRNA